MEKFTLEETEYLKVQIAGRPATTDPGGEFLPGLLEDHVYTSGPDGRDVRPAKEAS